MQSLYQFCLSTCFFLSFRYTAKNDTVYAIILGWPPKHQLRLAVPKTSAATKVGLMGNTYSARTKKFVRCLEVARTRTKFVLARQTQVLNFWEVPIGPAHCTC